MFRSLAGESSIYQVFILAVITVIVSVTMASSEPVSLSSAEMDALQTVTKGTNKFAITLYRALSKQTSGNVFMSPLSAQMVLVLAYCGAKGDTASEIAKLLSLPDKTDDLYTGYHSLIRVLQDPVLKMANRMFIEATAPIKKDFQKNAEKYFQSPAESVDFRANAEGSRKHINTWVENQTNKKIVDLLASGSIDSDTRLVLVNAIHFKADWKDKFLESDTQEKPFHVSKSKSVPVQMMHAKKKFGFAYDKELKAKMLELEYQGGQFRMVVILPDDVEGLSELEAKLDTVDLSERIRYMERPTVTVQLPKFKLEETMELIDHLKALGVKTMFDSHKADFSGLSTERLAVSKVVQKAFVEVNEKGTEAAAATGVEISVRSMPPPPQEFVADHPFSFLILSEDIVLFVGRLDQPVQ